MIFRRRPTVTAILVCELEVLQALEYARSCVEDAVEVDFDMAFVLLARCLDAIIMQADEVARYRCI